MTNAVREACSDVRAYQAKRDLIARHVHDLVVTTDDLLKAPPDLVAVEYSDIELAASRLRALLARLPAKLQAAE